MPYKESTLTDDELDLIIICLKNEGYRRYGYSFTGKMKLIDKLNALREDKGG